MSEDKNSEKESEIGMVPWLINWLGYGDDDNEGLEAKQDINELKQELSMTKDETKRKKIEAKIRMIEKSERANTPMRITGDE